MQSATGHSAAAFETIDSGYYFHKGFPVLGVPYTLSPVGRRPSQIREPVAISSFQQIQHLVATAEPQSLCRNRGAGSISALIIGARVQKHGPLIPRPRVPADDQGVAKGSVA